MAGKRNSAEVLLLDVLESVNDGVVIFDADDRLVICNSRYRTIYAPIAKSLVPGTKCEDLYRAWGDLGLFDLDNGTIEAQIQARIFRHKNPEGPFELHTTEHSLRIEEKVTKDGHVIGIHTDITAWKRMERAFQAYEGQLPGSVLRPADRFWTMDADLRFTTLVYYPHSNIIASPNSYIGHTRWEAVGVDPDTDEAWREHREDLRAHRPFENFRYSSPDGFGGIYFMSVSGTPVFGENGDFVGYHGTTTRISDAKSGEQGNPEDSTNSDD
jgi:PAS domain-containing protein